MRFSEDCYTRGVPYGARHHRDSLLFSLDLNKTRTNAVVIIMPAHFRPPQGGTRMNPFSMVAIVLTITAIFAVINDRIIKLHRTMA